MRPEIGCYGNTEIKTPNFDALAAESVVFENCFIEKIWNGSIQPAWWTGKSCLNRPRDDWGRFPLFEQLKTHGVHTTCVIDESVAPPDDLLPPFETRHIVSEDERPVRERADEMVARACDVLSTDQPSLVWLALPGMHCLPDKEFLDVFDEDFEDIGTSREFVDHVIAALRELPDAVEGLGEFEPALVDLILEADASQCDVILGRLLASLPDVDFVIVTAAFGGRFQLVGAAQDTTAEVTDESATVNNVICDQLIQVPWLLQGTDRVHRETSIVQPADLLPIISQLLGVNSTKSDDLSHCWLPVSGGREHAFASDESSGVAVRSKDFLLTSSGGDHVKLFVKPDDVWDIQDQSPQAPEDVQRLQATLEQRLRKEPST